MPRFALTSPRGGQIFPHHKGAARRREALGPICRAAGGAMVLAALLACGACSTVGIPDDDQLVTGSITPRATRVAEPLPEGAPPDGIGAADWIEAKRALEQAFASRERDVSIPWESPAGGAHGTATPIGAERAGGCRDFMVSVVDASAPDRWIQGTACRAKDALVLSQVRMLGRA